ncbi:hypothetical protein [Actinomyces minihominis]|uniref:hypothetical protein n=1 Tax=Actinomyces minihominis TaxID=2002838 RepID=UPI0013EA7BFD|nr:hypothetical protein [Actinomyces minihominis]
MADLERFTAASAERLSVLVHLAAAIGGPAAHLEALFTIEVHMAALNNFIAALVDQFSHGLATFRVAAHESNDGFERAAGLFRPDVIAAFVVFVPESRARVLLLVTILD